MEKDSFVFRREWRDAISGLPGEVRLEIYEAIMEYGFSGKSTEMKPMAMLAFNFAKTTLDRDAQRYEEIRQKRSEAGKLGGAPKGNVNSLKNPKNKQNKQMLTKQTNASKTSNSVYVSVNGSSNEDKKESISKDMPKKENFFDEMEDAMKLWLEYKKEIRDAYKTERGIKACCANLRRLSGGSPERAMAIVNQSIAYNWKGLFELKNDGKTRRPTEDERYGDAASLVAEKLARARGTNQVRNG